MIDHHDDNAGVSVAKPSSAARSPSTVYCTTAVQYTVNSDTVMVPRLHDENRKPTMVGSPSTVFPMTKEVNLNKFACGFDSVRNTEELIESTMTDSLKPTVPDPKMSSSFKKISDSAVYTRPDELDRPATFDEVEAVINDHLLHPSLYRASPNRMGRASPTFDTPSPAAAPTHPPQVETTKKKSKLDQMSTKFDVDTISANDLDEIIAHVNPDKRDPNTSFFSPIPTKKNMINRSKTPVVHFSLPTNDESSDSSLDDNDDDNNDRTFEHIFEFNASTVDKPTKAYQNRIKPPTDIYLSIDKPLDSAFTTNLSTTTNNGHGATSTNKFDTTDDDKNTPPFNYSTNGEHQDTAFADKREPPNLSDSQASNKNTSNFDLSDKNYALWRRLYFDSDHIPSFREFVALDSSPLLKFITEDMMSIELRPYLAWNVKNLRILLPAIAKASNLIGEFFEPTENETAAAHQLLGYNSSVIPYGGITQDTMTELFQAYNDARRKAKEFNWRLRRHLYPDDTDVPSKFERNPSDSSRGIAVHLEDHREDDHSIGKKPAHFRAEQSGTLVRCNTGHYADPNPQTDKQKTHKESEHQTEHQQNNDRTPTESENPSAPKRQRLNSFSSNSSDTDSLTIFNAYNNTTWHDDDSVGSRQHAVSTQHGFIYYRTFTFRPYECAHHIENHVPPPTPQYAYCAIINRTPVDHTNPDTSSNASNDASHVSTTTMKYYCPGNNTTSDNVDAYTRIHDNSTSTDTKTDNNLTIGHNNNAPDHAKKHDCGNRPNRPAPTDPANNDNIDVSSAENSSDDATLPINQELNDQNADTNSDSSSYSDSTHSDPSDSSKSTVPSTMTSLDSPYIKYHMTAWDLHHCMNISDLIAHFCVNYLLSNYVNQRLMRDLHNFHLTEVHNNIINLARIPDGIPISEQDLLPKVNTCIRFTLDKATRQVMTILLAKRHRPFQLPTPLPNSFNELLETNVQEEANAITTSCISALIYGLKTIYTTHHRLFAEPRTTTDLRFYNDHILSVICDVFSTAEALRMFQRSRYFKELPAFLNQAFKDQNVLYQYPLSLHNDPARRITHIDSQFWHIEPYITELIHSFNAEPADSGIAFKAAEYLCKQLLSYHGTIYYKQLHDNELPFSRNELYIGNLPPADSVFSSFASAFPVMTHTTLTDLRIDIDTRPPEPRFAFYFAMCYPFNYHITKYIHLHENFTYDYPRTRKMFQPIQTDKINCTFDFLPQNEYTQYRVTGLAREDDPFDTLRRQPKPNRNVLIYQGGIDFCPSYSLATPLECAIPRPDARTFPTALDGHGKPIIAHPTTGEAYNSTTVQALFTTQSAIPISQHLLDNPSDIPTSPHDPRFACLNYMYYVTDDPTLVPYNLAMRLIQVYTLSALDEPVYRSWALPHLDEALHQPIDQNPIQNRFSYYHQRFDHPEHGLWRTDERWGERPVTYDFTGEFFPNNQLTHTNFISGHSSLSSQFSISHLIENISDSVKPVIKFYQQATTTFIGRHRAFLAVQTRRSSLRPPTPTVDDPSPEAEPHTTPSASSTYPSSATTTDEDDDDATLILPHPSTTELPSSQTTASSHIPSDNETTDEESNPVTQPTTLQRLSLAVTQILTPKQNPIPQDQTEVQPLPTSTKSNEIPTPPQSQEPTDDQNPPPTKPADPIPAPSTTPSNTQPLQPSGATPRHPTFNYPPRVETFFNADSDSEEEPTKLQQTSPDALTSSTRTDFTYPPIEDLTKTLLKYANSANLKKLNYPTDLVARRRHFNTFMDNLRIVCTISPWTRHVFDQWPQKISYSHPVVGTSLYNLLFTHVTEQCQKHIIDGPPDFRTALFTLRRHCAPLTPDHVERTREAFYSLKQLHQEVATSYLNRIRVLTRDCYHAGIPNSDADLIKRTVRGGSSHHFYSASYQRFDADIRRAEQHDEPLPTFAELESYLLNIDETRGLTIPSQQVRNYNQHAHSTRHYQQSHNLSRSSTYRNFTPRQQQAFSSILRPYHSGNSNNNRPRPPGQHNHRNHSNNHRNNRPPPSNTSNGNRQHQPHRPQHITTRNNQRPPLRQNNSSSSNNHRRPPSSNNTYNASRSPTSNAANVVCNNCGRTGHYARNCTNPPRNPQSNRPPPRSPSNNNENVPPTSQNQQHRAYYVTDSSNQTFHHQAFRASSLDSTPDDHPQTVIWPDTQLPQMEVNLPLLDRDFPPSTHHQPPNTNTTELFPDDPSSPHQRFGPPHLRNWLPDSGATSHYTPVFSDLRDVEPCTVPISLADGSTKTSSHKGTAECHFTSDSGQKAILGLTDVYYVEGLSHRLLSLTAISGTQNFSVLIQNKATTIQFPDDSTFTWPLLRDELPQHQAFATTTTNSSNTNNDDLETEPFVNDSSLITTSNDTSQHLKPLPLELVSRRFAHRNFRNLMLGSLHQAWNDHTISPTIDTNNWPLRVSVSHKRARNKTPMHQGNDPFHRVHLDLMRNPFRFGLTTATNFSAYLFIVSTPGKLTGWIGLPTESTDSITTALKSWLTQTELLGRTQSVRFIRTDAGSAFTSAKFIATCNDLGIKLEAAAPEHQEMNGMCEAKWKEVHNTANTLLNTARLGGAFFHHAHAYAVQIINACPAKDVTDPNGIPITPYEFCYRRKPSIANFRVFGCPTFFKRYEPRFNNRLITHKQQLQRASRGIFLGFPDNSAGWIIYSPDQPQSIVVTRDAYFDENFDSALCFDSKPFAGAVPIRSHMNPTGLRTIEDNTEPSTFHQTGSAAHLGNRPSSFIDDTIQISTPLQHINAPNMSTTDEEENDKSTSIIPHTLETSSLPFPESLHGPIHPNPHQINMVQHQHRHTPLQKQMALYFQECNECPPSIDPIQTAMLTVDHTTESSTSNEPVDKYLPEPQSLKAVLKLDDDVRNAWLHAIRMEIKNLIDHNTFTLGVQPNKDELVIPVKLVLKAKQTATGKLDKLKARLVARGDMEKRRMKKNRLTMPRNNPTSTRNYRQPTHVINSSQCLPYRNPTTVRRHLVTLRIFKRGKTSYIYNLCLTSQAKSWRLHWCLPSSTSNWPSLC